jgi:hypothetical protein
VRIYYSVESAPMIVNSVVGFNNLHQQLRAFFESESRSISFTTDVSGSAEPYDMFLSGLEIEKTQGPINASVSEALTLRITGGVDNLKIYIDFFRFRDDEDGSHHHPEYVKRAGYISPGTLSVIIEADEDQA